MSDERVGLCGEHCAVVDECDARGREILRLRAENEKLRQSDCRIIRDDALRIIEEQRDEIEKLRAALAHAYEQCAEIAEAQRKRLDYELSYTGKEDDLKPVYPAEGHLIAAAIRAAAAALKET